MEDFSAVKSALEVMGFTDPVVHLDEDERLVCSGMDTNGKRYGLFARPSNYDGDWLRCSRAILNAIYMDKMCRLDGWPNSGKDYGDLTTYWQVRSDLEKRGLLPSWDKIEDALSGSDNRSN